MWCECGRFGVDKDCGTAGPRLRRSCSWQVDARAYGYLELQLEYHAKGVNMADTLKNRLERLVAQGADAPGGAATAGEAGELLLNLIRLEGRAGQLLSGTGEGKANPEFGFEGLALQEAALRVLVSVGAPLHVRELSARIKAGGWRHRRAGAHPGQLMHQLAARLPKYPEFSRVRPNTFALSAWGNRPPSGAAGPPRPVMAAVDQDLATWIGDHPEAPFEDSWPSS